mmetsp:Transcript_102899/g.236023  ORF Transcript_102899/g.236023 Transcript_102899/m.236023 type:complete len:91 (+) Transcript_102899:74-346(+)
MPLLRLCHCCAPAAPTAGAPAVVAPFRLGPLSDRTADGTIVTVKAMAELVAIATLAIAKSTAAAMVMAIVIAIAALRAQQHLRKSTLRAK